MDVCEPYSDFDLVNRFFRFVIERVRPETQRNDVFRRTGLCVRTAGQHVEQDVK